MERITIICKDSRKPEESYIAFVKGKAAETAECGSSPDEAIGHLIRELDNSGWTPFVIVEVIRIEND